MPTAYVTGATGFLGGNVERKLKAIGWDVTCLRRTEPEDREAAGKYALGVEFNREQAGQHGEPLGTSRLYVNNDVVAEGPMRAQIGTFTPCGDGPCVGFDSPTPSVGSTRLATNGTLSTAGLLSALPSKSARYRISTWGEKQPRRSLEIRCGAVPTRIRSEADREISHSSTMNQYRRAKLDRAGGSNSILRRE